jgi:hypothetical protein
VKRRVRGAERGVRAGADARRADRAALLQRRVRVHVHHQRRRQHRRHDPAGAARHRARHLQHRPPARPRC